MVIRILLALMLLSSCSVAQFEGPMWQPDCAPDLLRPEIPVHGQIWAGNSSMHGWTIELVSFGSGEKRETAPMWNGSFEFRGVNAGQHRLRVKDANGFVLHEEVVSLDRMGERLTIAVRTEGATQRRLGDTVSVEQLRRRPPSKALKAWKSGRGALEKGQIARAVEHLKTAIAADPAFADAHNDLGAAYFHLNQYDKSAEHLQKAVDLAPTHRQASNNLCLVLVKSERYAEAAQAADRVFKRGGGSPMAHYAAAIGLLIESGSPADTLAHLRAAEKQVASAHLLAARIMASRTPRRGRT